jgi:PKD repeat protein
MLRRSCQLAFLLLGLIWGGCLIVQAQATLDFTFEPTDPSVGEQVCFEAIVVTGDPSWFILYEWDFALQPAAPQPPYERTGTEVCRSFPTEGTWVVKLRATDDRGGYHYVEKTIVVTNESPTAEFTFTPAFPVAGALVSFNGGPSFDPDGVIVSYEWDFDNNGTTDATGLTVRYAFPVAGQRQVRLTVTDDGGGTGSVLHIVSVQPVPPVACFTHTPIAPSVYDDIQFSGDCSVDPDGGSIVQYSWAFGDGQFGNGAHVTHQYVNGGVYDVSLTVTDDDQQTNTVTNTVVVGGPTAAFTYTPLNPTTQDTVQFFDQSSDTTGDIATWSWNFGDGGGSSQQNPTHKFATAGPHNVQLTVTSDGGAISSATRVVTVRNAPPVANFTFSPATPDLGEMVTFSATGSSDPDGTIVSYEWDFNNDGVTDVTGQTATRAFSLAGARPVRLRVTDNGGAVSTVTKVVPVQAAPPVACFTFTPATPNTGQAVAFDGSCSNDADGTIILYEWDFNDDGVTDATGMSVTRSFPTAGVYPVTLTVTDNDGAVDANTRGVPVAVGGTSGDNQPPTANFSVSFAEGNEANIGEVVTFKSDGSSDADGTIGAYEWDFDDDGVYDATGTTAAHVYHTGGAKIVTLRVTDDDGAFGFKTRVVSVEFVRPTADFTFTPANPENGEVVQFDGSTSSDRDGTVEFYEWDFDNDGETDATGMTVTHVFQAGGAMPVTLTVVDDDGVFDFTTRTVPVTQNNPPVADFTYDPASPTTADLIDFASRSTDADGEIIAYLWDFDDGTETSVQTPSHRFTAAGTYQVTLTVTDDNGDTGEVTKGVVVAQVSGGGPTANFTFAPAAAVVDEPVQFTDTSTVATGTLEEWAWDFGDGDTSTAQNPAHTFDAVGTYTVRLTVTDSLDRTGTVTRQVFVSTAGGGAAVIGYPNPASRQVRLVVALPAEATDLVVRVLNIIGVAVFEHEFADGVTEYTWDLEDDRGEGLGNGLYFVVATAKDEDGRTIRSEAFRLLILR